MKRFEEFVYKILEHKSRKFFVIVAVLVSLAASVMMIPTKIVWVKMLPGKSANTFSVYVDLPAGSSIEQTKEVSQCVVDILKNEKEVTDIE
ncbi:MAG: efflux RND transporter permease subunit, partial [Epsilonproteobacteria bacterium]|nr:efflux RND transporter permease subunit [Campylobacterota bacterium]